LGNASNASPGITQIPVAGPFDAIKIGLDGKQTPHLSYTNGRAYYRAGDIILTSAIPKHLAVIAYPQLKDPTENDYSFWSILFMLTGCSEEETYKIGLRINHIGLGGQMNGSIQLQPVVFFDDTPVLLGSTRESSIKQLSADFFQARLAARSLWFAKMALDVAVFSEELVTSETLSIAKDIVAKRLFKSAARTAFAAGLTKSFNYVIRKFTKTASKCVFAFLTAAAKEFVKNVKKEDEEHSLTLRLEIGAAKDGYDHRAALEKAASAGVDALIEALLKELYEEPIMKPLDKAFEETLLLGKPKEVLRSYLKKDLTKFCSTEIFALLSSTLLDAWKDSIDDRGRFHPEKMDKELKDKLEEKLTKLFTSHIKNLAKSFGKDQANDLFTNAGTRQ
jgi:hypothetical protein